MKLIEVNTDDRRQVKHFIDLPFRLYSNIPQWVPPLEFDARRIFNRYKYPFYRHGEAAFFLLLNPSDTPVGRLAVLDNCHYNQYNREKTAFFYLFECENDPDSAVQLFDAAIQWARSRGLTRLFGPKGFTVFDGQGLLVNGFEHRPAFGLPYNPVYYINLIEAAGLKPAGELVSGYINRYIQFPEKIHQIAKILQERRGLHVARFNNRNDLRSFVPRLKDMYNGALTETSGNAPISDEEVKGLADQMIWFADPRLIKIVYKGDQPVGFLLAYPDISAAVQRTRGRIFPFGWIDLLLELRRTKWININGAGMMAGYRGIGGTALLFSEMYKSVVEEAYIHADVVQIGTENERMLRELRDIGIEFYKTHRMYTLDL
jgi:hypothetical protein